VTIDDRRVEILEQLDPARAATGVCRQLEEVERVRDRQGAGKVAEEDGTRLERRDEEWLAARIGLGKLRAELGDAPADLGAGQVDIPDGMSIRRERGS
jgi:hypothetical protein